MSDSDIEARLKRLEEAIFPGPELYAKLYRNHAEWMWTRFHLDRWWRRYITTWTMREYHRNIAEAERLEALAREREE